MNLEINGKRTTVTVRDLAMLLAELSYEGEWLATAVNGELVCREERADFVLQEGDRIEILSPMQGG